MKKSEIINLVDELLERYYMAESTAIDHFAVDDSAEHHDDLAKDIEDYRNRIRELVSAL